MNLKQTILSILGRDALKGIVDDLAIEGVDRRNAEAMRDALAREAWVSAALLLPYLDETTVKQVCEAAGVSATGRKSALVVRLLQAEDDERAAEPLGAGGASEEAPLGTSGPTSEQPSRGTSYRITRTELVWPGKYDEQGRRREVPRVSLPFQVIETVNESRATRQERTRPQQNLFEVWKGNEGTTFEDGWRNKLIWGDNLLVMGALLEKFAGRVDLVYIDPPFATGADFSYTTQIGEGDVEVTKNQSILEEKAYRDTWGKGISSWLQMMSDRLALLRELLSPNGAVYVHTDYRVAFHLRVLLDEVFGEDCFQNHVVWHYSGWNRHGDRYFNRRHDQILYYSRGSKPAFNSYAIPWASKEEYVRIRKQKVLVDKQGREYVLSDAGGGKRVERFLEEAMADGRPADDVWDLDKINNSSKEAVGYDTQKPLSLLERVLTASSKKGGLVVDVFCGSGTTVVAAEKLGRRWIGCDLGRFAIHTTRKRLLDIEGCRPFEVLNLGKYERQYWQGVTFGGDGPVAEKALYEYLAFILRLYGAQPVPGLEHLHGRKGRAMVHIGAVDAPITIDEVNHAIAECVRLKQPELHVLGWEWEMGLYDLMIDEAKKQGVKLIMLQIPREVMEQQAVDKGDVQFFELAYLEVAIQKGNKRAVRVQLKDFVIPSTELIPEDVRSKIKKWSDYIDYWAVDWDFRSDTFMQGWVTYRTRQDRSLALTSGPHTYEKPGRYRILVKVIDIFGNDTSQAFDVEVV